MAKPKRVAIELLPGTTPDKGSSILNFNISSDDTPLHALRCTDTDKIYFARPDPAGGFCARSLPFWVNAGNDDLYGVARNLFRYKDRDGTEHKLIGTTARLYSGDTNITPLSTSTTAIADSLDSNYTALGSNPITTAIGSGNVTVAHTAHRFLGGELIKVSGVSGTTGGITAGNINGVRSVTGIINANSYTISTGGTGTSVATGGGASVVIASKIIAVHAAAHGLGEDDRVKINAAADFAGFTAATQLNKEHLIRNVTPNTFDIVIDADSTVTGFATSSVTGGGGASTTYQKPIALPSEFTADDNSDPLIWSMAMFGNDVVMTPGNGGKVYIWQNDEDEAPVLLSGAPSAVHWLYVANNAIHTTFNNTFNISDAGDGTEWTPGPGTLAYTDDIEGYGRFISQVPVGNNTSLLFTNNRVGLFRFVGLPDLYDFEELPLNDGIISAMAREVTPLGAMWQGTQDFYNYDGASITKLEGITCHNTIFAPLYDNFSGAIHVGFAQHNPALNQVIFYFNANDTGTGADTYLIYDYKDKHSTLGRAARTAAENPYYGADGYYYMVGESSGGAEDARIYLHQTMLGDQRFAHTYEDDANPTSYFKTGFAMAGDGDTTVEIQEIALDIANYSASPRTFGLNISARDDSQGTVTTKNYTFTDTTRLLSTRIAGRQFAYEFTKDQSTGNVSSEFHFGKNIQSLQVGTPR